jgi:peptidoglycan hydrolase-like protein with peptidoglycan-binding domain
MKLIKIPGIGETTAKSIIDEYPYFEKDIYYILNQTNYQNLQDRFGSTATKQIRFTGCRNLQLQEQLNNLGYDIDGNASVTKKTDILLVPYQGFHSNKISKVSKHCQTVPIQDFMANPDKYLK